MSRTRYALTRPPHTHTNNTDRDVRTLIPEIDNGITVLKSTAVTTLLPAPSVSLNCFKSVQRPGSVVAGPAPPAGPVLWTVRWRLTRADRLIWAKMKVCTTGNCKLWLSGALSSSNWWLWAEKEEEKIIHIWIVYKHDKPEPRGSHKDL